MRLIQRNEEVNDTKEYSYMEQESKYLSSSRFEKDKNFWNKKFAKLPENYNGNQLFPLQLVIKDWLENNGLQLDFDYKTDIYTQEQITDMLTI